MPYELPIKDLAIETRADLAASLSLLLTPCRSALVRDGSGLFVSNESALYSGQVALLEGWSRLLWGIAPLRSGGFAWEGQTLHTQGLMHGTDPDSPNYWGDVFDYDQRMVEMAAIALALLLTPEHYWHPLSPRQKKNVATWLSKINERRMSLNNWLFFRVLVNLAFEKLGLEEFDPSLMESDLEVLEAMYADDGWYRDSVPFDNYNPLAMQYYALIYAYYRSDTDPERSKRFKERAALFARQHIHLFTEEGSFVPYGRSLTYRFAVVSFYGACAFVGLEVLPWGVLKGVVLRSLRWWFKQPIFDRDGFLSVGYQYPSRAMSEQYNAPGSPYWALKVYLILALDDEHPFWMAEEERLPPLEPTFLLRQPTAITQRTDDGDVVYLNGGQYPPYHMLHVAEKYAKFAYSARYTFSVAASYYEFDQTGCDSMLYVSDDDMNWRPRRESRVVAAETHRLTTIWKPYDDVQVTTHLIPAGSFHVRVHVIKSARALYTREGGFAIALFRGWETAGQPIETLEGNASMTITLPWDATHISDPLGHRSATSVKPMPNLNLANPTTIVPTLNAEIAAGSTEVLICCVGAWKTVAGAPQRPRIVFDTNSHTVKVGGRTLSL